LPRASPRGRLAGLAAVCNETKRLNSCDELPVLLEALFVWTLHDAPRSGLGNRRAWTSKHLAPPHLRASPVGNGARASSRRCEVLADRPLAGDVGPPDMPSIEANTRRAHHDVCGRAGTAARLTSLMQRLGIVDQAEEVVCGLGDRLARQLLVHVADREVREGKRPVVPSGRSPFGRVAWSRLCIWCSLIKSPGPSA